MKIVLTFFPQPEAVDILCAAYHKGFKWADYAWTIADISIPETYNSGCHIDTINNAILTHAKFSETVLPSGFNYSAYNNAYLKETREIIERFQCLPSKQSIC